jgi:hypothetical protein
LIIKGWEAERSKEDRVMREVYGWEPGMANGYISAKCRKFRMFFRRGKTSLRDKARKSED